MKKVIFNSIVVLAVALFAPQITQAQGTVTYLSNLGQPSTGSNPVGSDSWLAAGFRTGTNAGGYLLDSVQLAMTDASGNPSGFTVMLYALSTNVVTISPGSSLGTLDGSLNPVTSGSYTYTPAANLTLSPNTAYFIVLTAGTAAANGAYEWRYVNTSSYDPVDSWVASVTLSSSGGSFWTRLGASPLYDFSEFAINATGVPEPSVFGLFGLGGLFLAWDCRRAKAV